MRRIFEERSAANGGEKTERAAAYGGKKAERSAANGGIGTGRAVAICGEEGAAMPPAAEGCAGAVRRPEIYGGRAAE